MWVGYGRYGMSQAFRYFVLQYSNNPTMDGLRQTLPKFADVPWRLDRILNADAGTPVLPYVVQVVSGYQHDIACYELL